jgi:hypothetical protein
VNGVDGGRGITTKTKSAIFRRDPVARLSVNCYAAAELDVFDTY